MTELLLSKKVDVNVANHRNETPLHWCVFTEHVECARMLLKYGAKIQIANDNHMTPLDLAKKEGKTKMVNLLNCVLGLKSATAIVFSDDFNFLTKGITTTLALREHDESFIQEVIGKLLDSRIDSIGDATEKDLRACGIQVCRVCSFLLLN